MKIYSHGTSLENPLKRSHTRSNAGVGHRASKIDALDKLLGRVRYADDINLPRMVFGKIVRSPHAHANITKHVDLSFGDVERELFSSDYIIQQDFSFHNTTHASIEPHAAVADFNSQGRLTLYSSTQVPHYVHKSLSEVLKIPAHRIRV